MQLNSQLNAFIKINVRTALNAWICTPDVLKEEMLISCSILPVDLKFLLNWDVCFHVRHFHDKILAPPLKRIVSYREKQQQVFSLRTVLATMYQRCLVISVLFCAFVMKHNAVLPGCPPGYSGISSASWLALPNASPPENWEALPPLPSPHPHPPRGKRG